MEPVRVRVSRIIDFGRTVSIVGIDLTSNEPVTIHVDHRPFDVVLAGQYEARQSKPMRSQWPLLSRMLLSKSVSNKPLGTKRASQVKLGYRIKLYHYPL